ncbi:hypothetical protein KP509_10G046100 [Ceratopteris richardii]|uniref:Uncharacterized protein n=1 Tax=Ceratopteris richardii TaxID=49495 RepID=A0A8T2U0Z9_CERRI|nr:hypothetical protein KP509_10G046100 [Ceratopteris richardii]
MNTTWPCDSSSDSTPLIKKKRNNNIPSRMPLQTLCTPVLSLECPSGLQTTSTRKSCKHLPCFHISPNTHQKKKPRKCLLPERPAAMTPPLLERVLPPCGIIAHNPSCPLHSAASSLTRQSGPSFPPINQCIRYF